MLIKINAKRYFTMFLTIKNKQETAKLCITLIKKWQVNLFTYKPSIIKLPFLKGLKIKRLSIRNFTSFNLIYAMNSFALVKYVAKKIAVIREMLLCYMRKSEH